MDEEKKAKEKAMAILLVKDRTEKELEDKLYRAGFSEVATKSAIDYVKSFGYIDDLRYATNYIHFQRERRSRKDIQYKLMGRGVDKAVIAEAFLEYPEDEDTALLAAMEKKCKGRSNEEYDFQEKQKVFAYLARKGFRMPDIVRVWEERDG